MSDKATESTANSCVVIILLLLAQAFFIGLLSLALAFSLPAVLDFLAIEYRTQGFGNNFGVGLAISITLWFAGWVYRAPSGVVKTAQQ